MMKKIIFVSLLGLILSLSCNEKNTESVVNKDQLTEVAFDNLNLKLSEYNSEFTANNPVLKINWGNVFRVVKADAAGLFAGAGAGTAIGGAIGGATGGVPGAAAGGAIGGTIGGVIGATAFSLDAGFNPPTSNATLQSVTVRFGDYDFSNASGSVCDNAGYNHNKIIQNILASADFDGTDQMGTINKVIAEVEKLGFDVPQEFAPALYRNLVADKYIFDNSAEENILPALKARYPEYTQELSVVYTYLETLCPYQRNDGTIINYTKGFIEAIETSQIPEVSKEMIRAAVTIGANSSMLWREAND